MASDPVCALILARPDRWREGLRAILESLPELGPISLADDACTALSMIVADRPALVLLDASLPQDEIAGVVRDIKAAHPHTYCIVFVESAQQGGMAQAAGADRVLLKGFAAETLLRAIDESATVVDRPTHQ